MLFQNIFEWNSIKYVLNKTALHAAILKQNKLIVKILLANSKIDVNSSYKYYRIENYSTKTATYYYDKGYKEINNKVYKIESEKTPLYMAIESGNIEIVKLLLTNSKIDINKSLIQKSFFIL